MLSSTEKQKTPNIGYVGYVRTEIVESNQPSVVGEVRLDDDYFQTIFNDLIFKGETTTEVINRMLQRVCIKYIDGVIEDIPSNPIQSTKRGSVEVYDVVYRQIEIYAKDPRWCQRYHNSDLQQLRSGRSFNLSRTISDLLIYNIDYFLPSVEYKTIDEVKFQLKCYQTVLTENLQEKIPIRYVVYFLRKGLSMKKIKDYLYVLNKEGFIRLYNDPKCRRMGIGSTPYSHVIIC